MSFVRGFLKVAAPPADPAMKIKPMPAPKPVAAPKDVSPAKPPMPMGT